MENPHILMDVVIMIIARTDIATSIRAARVCRRLNVVFGYRSRDSRLGRRAIATRVALTAAMKIINSGQKCVVSRGILPVEFKLHYLQQLGGVECVVEDNLPEEFFRRYRRDAAERLMGNKYLSEDFWKTYTGALNFHDLVRNENISWEFISSRASAANIEEIIPKLVERDTMRWKPGDELSPIPLEFWETLYMQCTSEYYKKFLYSRLSIEFIERVGVQSDDIWKFIEFREEDWERVDRARSRQTWRELATNASVPESFIVRHIDKFNFKLLAMRNKGALSFEFWRKQWRKAGSVEWFTWAMRPNASWYEIVHEPGFMDEMSTNKSLCNRVNMTLRAPEEFWDAHPEIINLRLLSTNPYPPAGVFIRRFDSLDINMIDLLCANSGAPPRIMDRIIDRCDAYDVNSAVCLEVICCNSFERWINNEESKK
jgi:hypothetical protein